MKRSSSGVNFFSRYRDFIIVLVLLVAPFVFYVSNAKDSRDHNFLDRIILKISGPIQWVLVSCIEGGSDLWHSYVSLVNVEADNRRLWKENHELRRELLVRREQALENSNIRKLLNLKEQSSEISGVAATVVSMSPSPFYRSIRIDRGEDDGVRLGAGVVDHAGVVGRVVAVDSGWADVMLLVDANFSADVIVQRTRVRARVRGQGDDAQASLSIQYLERTFDIELGDILVTTGIGQVFPRGIEVGQVTVIEKGAFGLYQNVQLKPASNFARLETVMVIVSDTEKSIISGMQERGEKPLSSMGLDKFEEKGIIGEAN